ncbi:M48 family metallopeptidase [Arenimonas fontis]|uniref:M48 family metallopeptidase n=1 Tax=Arenimonas fontis TaxID=2608255 RepID=A0A5B2Z950_9GAMM|nr:M48 family metallopeptidase [Arenimonas fontis]KAA2285248.1 M48 family metallopeptidase [Arenimonas fontis]
MNFFERQERARRQSRRLVVLFALAVAAVVLAVDLIFLLAFGGLGREETPSGSLAAGLALASLVSLGIIGVASLYRVASLCAGGAAVAMQLGATPVPEDSRDIHYRRLRNVVEEIAIASGVPVPQIFVLEQEPGINAFAAGWSPDDAAVAVTRGALDRLNRDELQGVIAHEFSHILNGDMRLNIRLMGVLFGILAMALIGRKILQHGRGSGSRGSAPVLVAALGLVLVGYVGLFFGRLIKAGVSRQREFLADASAVQFTRQTRGLAGALKKIGGLQDGSKLGSRDAEEVAHMLFGDGVGYSRLFATHPPLLERIQALEPAFRPQALEDLKARWQMHPPSGLDEDLALGLAGPEVATASTDVRPPPLPGDEVELRVTPPEVVARVARPDGGDFARAGSLLQALPEVLRTAAHEREEAVPLLFGLLLAPPGQVRERQLFELAARHDERLSRQAADYADRLLDLPRLLHLPLAAMAMPALRKRPRPELERFMDTCFALSHADGRISLFEYCLGRLLRVQVHDALAPASAWVPGKARLMSATAPALDLLSILAQAGHDQEAEARRAYLAGVHRAFPRLDAPYRPPTDWQRALDEAWPVLDRLEPTGKELLLEALVAAAGHDGRMSVAEAELLRVVCAALHCPLPPLLERLLQEP